MALKEGLRLTLQLQAKGRELARGYYALDANMFAKLRIVYRLRRCVTHLPIYGSLI